MSASNSDAASESMENSLWTDTGAPNDTNDKTSRDNQNKEDAHSVSFLSSYDGDVHSEASLHEGKLSEVSNHDDLAANDTLMSDDEDYDQTETSFTSSILEDLKFRSQNHVRDQIGARKSQKSPLMSQKRDPNSGTVLDTAQTNNPPDNDDDSLDALEEEFAAFDRQHDDPLPHGSVDGAIAYAHQPTMAVPARRAPSPPSPQWTRSERNSPPHSPASTSREDNGSFHSEESSENLQHLRQRNKSKERRRMAAPQQGEIRFQSTSPQSDRRSPDLQDSPRRKRKNPPHLVKSHKNQTSKRLLYDPLGSLDETVDPEFAEPPQGRQKLRHSPPRRRESPPAHQRGPEDITTHSPGTSPPHQQNHQHEHDSLFHPDNHTQRDSSYYQEGRPSVVHSPRHIQSQYADESSMFSPNWAGSTTRSPPLQRRADEQHNTYGPPEHSPRYRNQPFLPPQYPPEYSDRPYGASNPPRGDYRNEPYKPPTHHQQHYFYGYDAYGRPVYHPFPPIQPMYPPHHDQPYPQPPYPPQQPFHEAQSGPEGNVASQAEHQQYLMQQQSEKEKLHQEMENIKRERDELIQQNNKVSQNMQSFTSQQNNSKQKVAELDRECQQLSQQNEKLTNENRDIQSALEATRQKLLDKTKELQSVQNELTELKYQTTETDSQLSHIKQKDSKLEETIHSIQSKNIALQKNLDTEMAERRSMEEKVAQAELKHSDALIRIKELEKDCQKKNNEISNMNHQLDSIRHELQKAHTVNQHSQDELDDLRVKKDSIQNQLKQSTTTAKTDQNSLRKYMLEAESLKKECLRAKQQLDHFEKESNYLHTQIKNLKDTVHTLQSQQTNYVRAKETAQSDYNRLKADFDAVLMEKDDALHRLRQLSARSDDFSPQEERNPQRSSRSSYAHHPPQARSPPVVRRVNRSTFSSSSHRDAPFATNYERDASRNEDMDRSSTNRRVHGHSPDDSERQRTSSSSTTRGSSSRSRSHGSPPLSPRRDHNSRKLSPSPERVTTTRSAPQPSTTRRGEFVPSAEEFNKLLKVVDYYHRSLPQATTSVLGTEAQHRDELPQTRYETHDSHDLIHDARQSPDDKHSEERRSHPRPSAHSTPQRNASPQSTSHSPKTERFGTQGPFHQPSPAKQNIESPTHVRIVNREQQQPVVASENTPFANQHSLTEQIQNTAKQEKELMDLNIEKNALDGELQRLYGSQRTMANRKRRVEVEKRLEEVAKRQSQIRRILRDAGAL
eukprot:CAMPEP_0117436204 /NCGR_PEP_ID=MMETSP0759-20121206/886_1 /TAXON_ID=63605 /ORGANISM="Percolomonas cosmopolitus, Strain WS" /LENGTH=1235 /DNA_ID=CAMNT_0005227795 /DNA_START=8 /DNA_END=3715 /DNA_ORIENTATION=+